MPVGNRFIDIIIRRDSIASKFAGGWEGFLKSDVHIEPIGWYDDYLYRTGVMYPPDIQIVMDKLNEGGLTGLHDNEWVDYCVLDLFIGTGTQCTWLDPAFRGGSRFMRDKSTLVHLAPGQEPIDVAEFNADED
jgi:hypothetical protein